MRYLLLLLTLLPLGLAAQTGADTLLLRHGVAAEQVIHQPADRVWELIADWNNLGRIAPNVDRTVMRGRGLSATWVIYVNNGLEVPERMLTFSDALQRMSYTMVDPPLPLRNYVGVIDVDPIDNATCLLSFHLTFEAQGAHRAKLIETFHTFQEAYFAGIEAVLAK